MKIDVHNLVFFVMAGICVGLFLSKVLISLDNKPVTYFYSANYTLTRTAPPVNMPNMSGSTSSLNQTCFVYGTFSTTIKNISCDNIRTRIITNIYEQTKSDPKLYSIELKINCVSRL